MNEPQEVIVTDWSAEVTLALTLKDLFKIRLAMGQLNSTMTNAALNQCFEFGSLPEQIKKEDMGKLFDMLMIEAVNLDVIINKFNSAFEQNTYKEYEQKQYKISYIWRDTAGQEYYLYIDEAIERYKEIVNCSRLFSNLKLESVSCKSKVKISD